MNKKLCHTRITTGFNLFKVYFFGKLKQNFKFEKSLWKILVELKNKINLYKIKKVSLEEKLEVTVDSCH